MQMNAAYRQLLIDDMEWSYSRIRSFSDCPYKWLLRYIYGIKEQRMFFSTYGEYMHSLLERYYSGAVSRSDLIENYLTGFSENVIHGAPNQTIFKNYFTDGLLCASDPPQLPCRVAATEQRVNFTFGGKRFVGFIDVIGQADNELYIIDHKSRTLKPRSKRNKPTATDRELDEYLKQLYLYSIPIQEQHGKLPASLLFNCFRSKTLIKQEFDVEKFDEAKSWALGTIDTIRNETEFRPKIDFFKCKYLCGVHDHCEYYHMNFEQ